MLIQRTAKQAYSNQGPGVGANDGALDYLKEFTDYYPQHFQGCLEIGFGQGELLKRLVHEIGCDPVSGVDIAESCWEQSWVKDFLRQGHQHIVIQDCSHTALPFDDDTYDFAFCTETIEHLSNPFFMVSEVKRVLKHNGIFVLAFPMPEDNLGYDGGEHAHIYPGFLLQEPFELFMKQLYFKIRHHRKNGSSAWYTFQSYKQRGVVSAFDMGHSNYTEAELFKCLEDF